MFAGWLLCFCGWILWFGGGFGVVLVSGCCGVMWLRTCWCSLLMWSLVRGLVVGYLIVRLWVVGVVCVGVIGSFVWVCC